MESIATVEARFRDALADLAADWQPYIDSPTMARIADLVSSLGPVRVTKRILSGDLGWEGFTTLFAAQRFDLSLEGLVLRPEFATLFSETERQGARARLAQFGYIAPWDAAQ